MKYEKINHLEIKIGDGNYSSKYPKASEFLEEGVPFISARDFLGRQIRKNEMRYISNELHEKLLKGHLKVNDILIVVRGNGVGKIGFVKDDNYEGANLNAQLAFLRPNSEKIDPYYLYYLLSSAKYQKLIANFASGSAQPQLTLKNLGMIEIEYPSIRTQREIGIFGDLLDSKIELNNQMIDTLEEMASTLFKRWFVDFEFPDENGNPYKSSGGKMIDSELGEIPEEWEISSIDEISKNIVTGKTPSTKKVEFYGGNIPFITIPDMHNKTFIVESERYLTEEGKVENKILPPNSICVSCIATPGLVVFNSIESQTNQQINSIVPHGLDKYWLFLNLKSKKQLIRDLGSGGSTTLNLNKTQFGRIQLISPQNEVKEKFNVVVKPLFDLILGKLRENVTLVDSRDSLLPKLLSGELEV